MFLQSCRQKPKNEVRVPDQAEIEFLTRALVSAKLLGPDAFPWSQHGWNKAYDFMEVSSALSMPFRETTTVTLIAILKDYHDMTRNGGSDRIRGLCIR